MAKRRSRWGRRILAILLTVVLLAGAAEVALRLVIPGVVGGIVREQLRLTDDHPVEVTLGGSALLNALRGGIGDATIDIPNAPLVEGIPVDAEAYADFSPWSPGSGEIRGGRASLTVPREQLGAVIGLLTSGVAQTGEVRGGELAVGRTVEAFGQSVPITARIGIAVTGGDVEIDPRGVSAAGLDLSAEQISQATGSLLDPILEPQTVCVRDRIPAGITLTGIVLSSTGSVRIEADLAPEILSDPAQLEPGSCG
ncbi:LmeA family phospholipid-binding protein [Leucobacter sp. wl10]|uniref:LmeA family phospholipid-binding protein n=1 Tax=Leucobacter sp. wl10 TaxID=2304677 RepID=UPI000E5AC5DD|nr:LmeA family phospholipid-binding protein [Leucobacter sp. wl10]RGE21069.1 hypothetical protein D1J51_07555 [Leucobacter sp. wl10]